MSLQIKPFIFSVLMIASFCSLAHGQKKLSAKDIKTIKNIEEIFRTAWLKNDEKTILSLFTDDASLYPGGGAPVRGKNGLYKYWFAPSDTITTITGFEISIEDVSGENDFATVTASDEIFWTTEKKDKTGQKRFVSKGYFIAVYVKKNNEWKIWKRFAAGKTEEIK